MVSAEPIFFNLIVNFYFGSFPIFLEGAVPLIISRGNSNFVFTTFGSFFSFFFSIFSFLLLQIKGFFLFFCSFSMLVSLPSSHFIESSHAPLYPPPLPPGLRVVRPPGAGSCHKPLTVAQQGPANKRHPTSCVFETLGALPRVTTGWLLCCVVFVRAVLCLGRQRSPCQQHTATASPTSLLHPPLKKNPGTGNSSRTLPVALSPGQEVEAASQEERLAG